MANGKETAAVNLEQLINQQSEVQKSVREKRKDFREVEKKNRDLKAQIVAALNLPKGVNIVIKRS